MRPATLAVTGTDATSSVLSTATQPLGAPSSSPVMPTVVGADALTQLASVTATAAHAVRQRPPVRTQLTPEQLQQIARQQSHGPLRPTLPPPPSLRAATPIGGAPAAIAQRQVAELQARQVRFVSLRIAESVY